MRKVERKLLGVCQYIRKRKYKVWCIGKEVIRPIRSGCIYKQEKRREEKKSEGFLDEGQASRYRRKKLVVDTRNGRRGGSGRCVYVLCSDRGRKGERKGKRVSFVEVAYSMSIDSTPSMPSS